MNRLNTNTAPAGRNAATARLKKPIVILAGIALALILVSGIVIQIAAYNLYYRYGMIPQNFGEYIIQYFSQVLFNVTVPAILGGLFVLFCCLIGRKSLALTGIPVIAAAALSIINRVIQVIRGEVHYNIGYWIVMVFCVLISAVFIVFYMLAVTRKFKSATAGKVLVIVFACIILTGILLNIIGGITSFVQLFGSINIYTIIYSIGLTLRFVSRVLAALALILCIFYASKQKDKAAS